MPGLAVPDYDLDGVPSEVIGYPGMTTPREKAMLFWLAKNVFEGKGLIVAAGLFLGASTNAFAAGARQTLPFRAGCLGTTNRSRVTTLPFGCRA